MYSRKSVGPRMEPWRAPALTGYFCEDFPSRATQSRLLLKKEETRPQISDLKFHKTSNCEEEQHAKPCEKPWIYQVPQLE